MDNSIVLKISEGSFENGFSVELIQEKSSFYVVLGIEGKLPPNLDLIEAYNNWQTIYYRLDQINRLRPLANQVKNFSHPDDCKKEADSLKNCFNDWLDSKSFSPVREGIIQYIKSSEKFRLMVQTDNLQLQKLPWHLWKLIEKDYPQIEIVLSSRFSSTPVKPSKITEMKILAVFGDDTGIELEEDKRLLNNLPRAKLTFLEQPTLDTLNNHLWEESYDIFFFSGHSGNGTFGIDKNQNVTIEGLSLALKDAVKKGLKLAIFCSCDGLGIARALVEIGIPQVIVMREPIPDVVSQKFLKHLLEQLINKRESFYLSVRHARERLQVKENDYPCATWLPIVYQNPRSKGITFLNKKYLLKLIIGGLILCAAIVPLVLWIIGHRNYSERISKGEKVLIDLNNTPYKESGVRAFAQGNYALAESKFKTSLKINPNDPETLIYLNNAEILQKQKEAFLIAVSIPITSNPNVAQEILRGVAQAQNEVNNKGGIKGIPLQVKIADDENNPQIAQELADIFVKDPEVMAVVGHNASDASVAAAPIYEQGKLVMISPTSFSQKLSSMGQYIFRTVFDIRLMSEPLADYVVKVKKKSVAVCLDSKSIDNESFIREFNAALYANGAKLVDIKCDLADPNLNADQIVSEAIAEGSDSILLGPHIDRINQAIAIIKVNKQRLTLLGSPTLNTWQTLKTGQADVKGLVLAVPWETNQHPNHPFVKEALSLWKAPVNWRTATSYDATWTIFNGLKQSQSRQTLSQVLHNNNFSFKGATGIVQFLPSGDRQKAKGVLVAVLVQVQPSTKSPTGYDFIPLK